MSLVLLVFLACGSSAVAGWLACLAFHFEPCHERHVLDVDRLQGEALRLRAAQGQLLVELAATNRVAADYRRQLHKAFEVTQ